MLELIFSLFYFFLVMLELLFHDKFSLKATTLHYSKYSLTVITIKSAVF